MKTMEEELLAKLEEKDQEIQELNEKLEITLAVVDEIALGGAL